MLCWVAGARYSTVVSCRLLAGYDALVALKHPPALADAPKWGMYLRRLGTERLPGDVGLFARLRMPLITFTD